MVGINSLRIYVSTAEPTGVGELGKFLPKLHLIKIFSRHREFADVQRDAPLPT